MIFFYFVKVVELISNLIYENHFANVVKFILRNLYHKILPRFTLRMKFRKILPSLSLRKMFRKMFAGSNESCFV